MKETTAKALAALQAVLTRHDLSTTFPDAVMREVQQQLDHPGIDDSGLEDLTALPLVTIDYAESLDLDQAMFIERGAAGFTVYYALADAAHYVRPGTALFTEALARGVSYYLPRLVLPMLPAELSEGIVSLNPNVDRRAVVFVIQLDAGGQAQDTELLRARVHSRAKLTYDGVQRFLDRPEGDPLAGQPYSETLELLREVGQLRMDDARRRDVVSFNREDVEVDFTDELDGQLCFKRDLRNMASRYNEQISLLCNIEGARLLLRHGPEPHVQPVFRVHEAPSEGSREHLARMLEAMAAAHGLDSELLRWRRDAGESLGDFLDRLRGEPGVGRRLLAAVERQALITNQRSVFSSEPGRHFALGVKPYARFSAPMREIVGIFTHKEALEKQGLCAAPRPAEEDELLREQVIDAANRAKQRQRRISKDVLRLALDQLLRADLSLPLPRRPIHRGTILGLNHSRLYVRLDSPSVELKVYVQDMERALEQSLELRPDEVELRSIKEPGARFRLGDEIRVRTGGHDQRRDRWRLEPQL